MGALSGLTLHKELVISVMEIMISRFDKTTGKTILDNLLPVLSLIAMMKGDEITSFAMLGLLMKTSQYQWHVLN